MCFRPPEAGAGEIVCKHCFMLNVPNADGTCPDCGELMVDPEDMPNIAPSSPASPAVPNAPVAPGAPPQKG